MSEITLPRAAPEEVITKAILREIDLTAFGAHGTLSLITLDNGLDHSRPNTFGPNSLKALNGAITDAENSSSVAIAITGKAFHFAAGADLASLAYQSDNSQALAIGKFGHDVFRRLGEGKKPTFAFINGLALGGGLELALHCKYRTIATTAITALPEVFLGLVPGWGGTTILPKLIGPENAVKVIILNALNNNTMMKVDDALILGIADVAFEPADFLERSINFAAQVICGATKIERVEYTAQVDLWEKAIATGIAAVKKKYGSAEVAAPAKALELIAAARTNSFSEGFDAEDAALATLAMSDSLRASLYAFNLIQKKRKKVEGAPKPALARKVEKVGIVGAGLMASQLALIILKNLKVPVVIMDLDQERVDKGLAYIASEIKKLVEKKYMTPELALRISGLISGSTVKSIFKGCSFVIEAIFEEIEAKKKLFRELESIVSTECILATNTSSLSVAQMAEGLANPERVVGFHFFNPVALMPLLEIARTVASDDATIATAVSVGKELKKTIVIVKDSPAFVVNRLLTRFMSEITDCIYEGTDPAVADGAMKPLGLPMTALELLSLVGPGIALHVAETLNISLGERYRISPIMKRFVSDGVKTFYLKNLDGSITPNPAAISIIRDLAQTNPTCKTEGAVRERALKALAQEARAMLEEGVVSSAAEIDLCMLLGCGWPLHLGGILPYLDREGISDLVCGQRFHPPGVASLPS